MATAEPGPPDFVGVGVQKAGTTWWFSLIAAHPTVAFGPGAAKELHFFDPFWDTEFTADDVTRYHASFARPRGMLAGEWTPRYIFDPWTLPLLRIAAPQARVMVLLRDPVTRYSSGLTQSLATGRIGPSPTLATAAFNRGLYADQIRRLLDVFPRSQVLILQYERCVACPETELARTYGFLGLDPGFTPQRLREHVLKTGTAKVPAIGPLTETLTAAYQRDVLQLASIAPEIDFTLWTDTWPNPTRSRHRHTDNSSGVATTLVSRVGRRAMLEGGRLRDAARTPLSPHARRIVASILQPRNRTPEHTPVRAFPGDEPTSEEPPPVRFDPGHYYSPMYDSRELLVEPARSRIWPPRPHERPGIDWREDAQRSFMVDVLGAQKRMALRDRGDPEDGEYYALNGQFPPLDAWALEGMLRHLRPHRMIEVGSGFSALISAQVNREFLDGGMDLVCIEPYPRGFLSTGVAGIGKLVVAKVEDVPLERFQALDRGDVLFIDTSHVVRTGNDVAWIYGQILPRLRPGVHVHIHDVFLPGDYPMQWVREGWGWNENYLVEAFLNFNEAFEIVFGTQWARQYAGEELARAFPDLEAAPDQGGGSLWLRRT